MFQKQHQKIKNKIIPIEDNENDQDDDLQIITPAPTKKRKLNPSSSLYTNNNNKKQFDNKKKSTQLLFKKMSDEKIQKQYQEAIFIDQHQDSNSKNNSNQQQKQNHQEIYDIQQQDKGFIKFESIKKSNQDLQIDVKKSVPWLSKSTLEMKQPLFRFHNEIIDFYNYIKPSKKQHKQRNKKLSEIQDIILQQYPQAEVTTFGSFTTKLYLPQSDIDVAVLIDNLTQWEVKSVYDCLYKKFLQYPQIFTKIQYIRKAKVPLIKFVDGQLGIQVDVSVNKKDGIQQIKHVQQIMQRYPEFKYLVFVFKCTLKIRNLSQTYTGGVGSFLLYSMIYVYLREMHKRKKNYLISQHVLRFMQFWSMGKMDQYTVLVQNGQMIERQKQPFTLSIISPQDPNHDIGRAAFNVRDVIKVFRNRFRYITNTKYKLGQSILKDLINPACQVFRYYEQIQRLNDTEKKIQKGQGQQDEKDKQKDQTQKQNQE